jgi:hypothetical protein
MRCCSVFPEPSTPNAIFIIPKKPWQKFISKGLKVFSGLIVHKLMGIGSNEIDETTHFLII